MNDLFPEEYDFLFQICKDIYMVDCNDACRYVNFKACNWLQLNNKEHFMKEILSLKEEHLQKYTKGIKHKGNYILLEFRFGEVGIDFRYYPCPFRLDDIISTHEDSCSKITDDDIDNVLRNYPDFVYHLDLLNYLRTDWQIRCPNTL